MRTNLIFYFTLGSLFLGQLDMNDVLGADADEVKSVSVTEGGNVTLNTDVQVQKDDQILWTFGLQETRIAEIHRQNIHMFDSNETFEKRLQIDNQTGDLTIRNIKSEHTGLYKLQIIRNSGTSYKRFNITLYALLAVPVITSNSSNCSSSLSNCSLLCSSAVNVSHVTLSWYKGNSLLSSISVSDLSISLSLPLEVEYQDKNSYSCVINNPITNHTTHLNMDLCKPCSKLQTVLFIAAALLFALAGGTYALYWKHKRTAQKGNGFEPCANVNVESDPKQMDKKIQDAEREERTVF